MKKIITLSLFLSTFLLQSQTSIVLTRQSNSLTVSANATINLVTVPFSPITVILDVTNTSTTTNNYHVKRYALIMHSTASATADATFYFGGNDYAPSTANSNIPLTLSPNQNSGTMGDYYSLGATLEEANTIGYSVLKYTIFNAAQVNDSIQVVFRYNAPNPVGVQQSELALEQWAVYPNPTTQQTTLSFVSKFSDSAALVITNALGQIVYKSQISISTGLNKNTIQLNELPAGLYNIALEGSQVNMKQTLVLSK